MMDVLELLKVLDRPSAALPKDEQEADDWKEAFEELMNKSPFDMISDLGDRVEELKEEVRRLKHHKHVDGDICVPIHHAH